MNTANRFFMLAFALCIILPVLASAHSGRTDAKGGHYNGSEYHYHHGYPAHQHTNGECPYNFDDRTGMNSGSSSNKSSSSKASVPSKDSSSEDGFALFGYLLLASPFILIIISVIFRRKTYSPAIFFCSSILACPIAVAFIIAAAHFDLPGLIIVFAVLLSYYLMFRLGIFIFFRD